MVDLFALAVPHLLMALACWRLMLREELDRESPPKSLADGKEGERA